MLMPQVHRYTYYTILKIFYHLNVKPRKLPKKNTIVFSNWYNYDIA